MFTWKRVHKIDAVVVKEGEQYYVVAPSKFARLIPFECALIKMKPDFYEYLRDNLLDDLVQDFLDYKFKRARRHRRT